MKQLYILFLLGFIACNTQKQYNKTVSYKDSIILLGPATERGLQHEAPFSEWYGDNFKNYTIDTQTVNTLKPLLKGVTIKLFMGTWCSDSKREVPRFFKILKAADYNTKKVELIAVNREKTTPQNFENGLNIIRVPTFIFYKNGKEINRIVEFPVISLEKDMLSILTHNNYKHSYAQ